MISYLLVFQPENNNLSAKIEKSPQSHPELVSESLPLKVKIGTGKRVKDAETSPA
jgi:hypothetical protein